MRQEHARPDGAAGVHHVDLERASDLALVEADPEGYLQAHPRRLAADEAQRLPSLFAALRAAIDSSPGKGRFALTGSASASPAAWRS